MHFRHPLAAPAATREMCMHVLAFANAGNPRQRSRAASGRRRRRFAEVGNCISEIGSPKCVSMLARSPNPRAAARWLGKRSPNAGVDLTFPQTPSSLHLTFPQTPSSLHSTFPQTPSLLHLTFLRRRVHFTLDISSDAEFSTQTKRKHTSHQTKQLTTRRAESSSYLDPPE